MTKCYLRFVLFLLIVCNAAPLFSQDLEVLALDFTTPQVNFRVFTCEVTIVNNDNIEFSNYSMARITLSKDQNISEDDIILRSFGFTGMKANEKKVFNVTGSHNGIDIPPGEYYLIAVADARNEVEESNEDNNVFIAPITISAAEVDYRFANISKNKVEVAKGDVVEFTYSLNNLYGDNISWMSTSFYLSEDDVFDESDVLWETMYNNIDYKKSTLFKQALKAPLDAKDSEYFVFAKMENYGQGFTTEPLTAFGRISLFEAQRDLSIDHLYVHLRDFKSMSVRYNITNYSDVGIQGHAIKYYFSKDKILDESDIHVFTTLANKHRSQYIGPNAQEFNSDYHHAFSMEEYLPAGEWYVIAEFNYDRKFSETNYENNIAVSNQITVPEYKVELRVEDLEFNDGVFVSQSILDINLSLINENVDAQFTYNATVRNSEGVVIAHGNLNSGVNSFEKAMTRRIHFRMSAPLAAGDYTIAISSDPYMPLFEKVFTVAPLFSDMQETIDKTDVNLSWSAAKASGNYIVEVSSDNFIESYSTNNTGYKIPKNQLAPGVYEWTVKEIINGEEVISEVSSFEVLPIDVRTSNLALSKHVNDSDSRMELEVEVYSDNYVGEADVTIEITDELGEMVQHSTVVLDLGIAQQYAILLELDDLLVRGNYKLSISTAYSSKVSLNFSVNSSVSALQSKIDNSEITFQWDSELSNDYADMAFRIFSTTYDSTFMEIGANSHTLPSQIFAPGDYNWYITALREGKTYQSETFTFSVNLILGIKDQEFIEKINLYPNPTLGKMYMNLPQNEGLEIYLSDYSGKTFAIEKFTDSQGTTIDISPYSNGFYILTIRDKSTQQTYLKRKIMKH